ncbi:carbohydrate ABC transporter permease [Bifidobacterium callimiconis]|uniref:Binding-protein-dependent transport systems inner membrane component n=1 Tax=Bifidobacterium callimiconis TaxID=2306973 RepID=A0A430FHV5_9BIFI|nr:sugar ABC transporter permease [Bifidobacterium callimiconis]RSX52371.1 binding-protein-dependent transport systems inner membrane component [Bifidobacterium callimiconis]
MAGVVRRWLGRVGSYSAERQPRAWLLLLPALVCIGVFNVLPLVRVLVMAFQSGTLRHLRFAGWSNFVAVFADPSFVRALVNTGVFAVVTVPVGLVVSLMLAVAVDSGLRGSRVFEALLFVPYLTSVVAVGVVFRYLFNGDYGVVNYVLSLVGLGPFDFLNDPRLSMVTLCVFGVWLSLAFNIVILLSGLRAIDPMLYRVADLYGASAWERFSRITLPQLAPMITFLSIMDLINAFKVYTEVYVLFNGKPGVADSAVTAVFYVYDKFYVQGRYGQGMAAAVVLFMLILVFTLLQSLLVRRLSK